MVRRKQAGLSHRQIATKTSLSLHKFRRWEYDRCVPSQAEWDTLREVLHLPLKPFLTFAHPKTDLKSVETIGGQLRQRRLALKLCLAAAASRLGICETTLGLWELNQAFPKAQQHAKIAEYLGYNPFPA